jgi:hypothetical protein
MARTPNPDRPRIITTAITIEMHESLKLVAALEERSVEGQVRISILHELQKYHEMLSSTEPTNPTERTLFGRPKDTQ